MLYLLNPFNTFKIAIALFTIAEWKILALIRPHKKFNLFKFWGVLQFFINLFQMIFNNDIINRQITFTIKFYLIFCFELEAFPKNLFFKFYYLINNKLLQTIYWSSLIGTIFTNHFSFYQFLNLKEKFFLPFAIGYFLFITVILNFL